MKKYAYFSVIVMIVAMMGFAVGLMLSFISGRSNLNETDISVAESFTELDIGPILSSNSADFDDEFFQSSNAISPETRIVYEYYITEGEYERVEETPAQVLLGMNQEEISALFADWELIYFSPLEVHLRQSAQLDSIEFVIGVHEGFIAVFYNDADDQHSIKEMTNRPITALAEEEQKRLLEGIKVLGNEELIRALEDFSS